MSSSPARRELVLFSAMGSDLIACTDSWHGQGHDDSDEALDRLDGRLLLPGDAGYDEARTVWNAMVDRRPRMIARCASVRDVVTAVRTARELDLEIGVRCGGHGALGLAVPTAAS